MMNKQKTKDKKQAAIASSLSAEIYNLDVIKTSDWIIDVGPEGGDNGGLIVAQGTPEEIIKTKKSYTGKFLKEIYK